jgi:hypothetical protein
MARAIKAADYLEASGIVHFFLQVEKFQLSTWMLNMFSNMQYVWVFK